ncbi:MAG TPA: M14 family metallopeptidase [Fimbriimonadaceae bacterium]|nr:M14 family metallopeptidase [Fimbriimonadaceae bacterium]
MFVAALSLILQQAAWPETHAEATDYKETSGYAHVVDFLDTLQLRTPVKVQYIGTSQGGRRIPMAIASLPPVTTPLEAKRSGKPIVYIEANIHGGEVEGKEAAQMLLRNMYRDNDPLLHKLIFLVVPIYNIDGNESWGDGATNRSEQTGPAIVGLRTNGAGLDLNRDCMKAESPEMQAALSGIYNPWDPDVVLDLHTTDGTRHGYGLTYSPSLHPDTYPAILDYSRDELLPKVRQKLQGLGLETFDYGNAGTRDGKRAWSTFGYEGRYVTNYSGLRNRITILSEAMSHNTFKQRVHDTYLFVRACLEQVAADADRIVSMSKQADADMVAWGKEGHELGVRFEMASRGTEDVLMEKPQAEGAPRPTGPVTEVVKEPMTIYDRFVATRKAWVPAAYIVPASETKVVALLLRHGVVVERLRKDLIADATTFTVSLVAQAQRPFQGRQLVQLEGAFRTEGANIPAGSYLVRTSQPLGVLIFNLLEPESLDGVVAWGFLSALPETAKPYPILKLHDDSGAVAEIVTNL